jgi:hypothetical protein
LLDKLLQILLKLDEQILAAGEAGSVSLRCAIHRISHAADTASRCFLYVCAVKKKSYSWVKRGFFLWVWCIFYFEHPPPLKMEFLNANFTRKFLRINSSLLRLEFLSGFLPSFFLSTRCYSRINSSFLVSQIFCVYFYNQSRVWFFFKNLPIERL